MSNQDILLAAKAIGLKLFEFKNQFYLSSVDERDACGTWNPVYCSDQCLELAVALQVDIEQKRSIGEVWVVAPMGNLIKEPAINNNYLAATRRAVFKAAVEKGRAME